MNSEYNASKSLFDPIVKLAKVDGMYAMSNVYPNLSRHIFTDTEKAAFVELIRNSASSKGFARSSASTIAKRYQVSIKDVQRWRRIYKQQESHSPIKRKPSGYT